MPGFAALQVASDSAHPFRMSDALFDNFHLVMQS
jgi:hypothetical protein